MPGQGQGQGTVFSRRGRAAECGIHEQTHAPSEEAGQCPGFAQDWGPQLDSASFWFNPALLS